MNDRPDHLQRLSLPAAPDNPGDASASPQGAVPWVHHRDDDETPVAPMFVAARLVRCRACGGRGVVHVLDPEGPFQHALTCPICDGAGRFASAR
jgi:hypothetical protein